MAETSVEIGVFGAGNTTEIAGCCARSSGWGMDQPKNRKGEASFHGSCVPKKQNLRQKSVQVFANEDDFL